MVRVVVELYRSDGGTESNAELVDSFAEALRDVVNFDVISIDEEDEE